MWWRVSGLELGGDEEALGGVVAAVQLHDEREHRLLVGGVHTLVDLVDDAERHGAELVERQDEAHGRDRALPPRLPPSIQRRQFRLLPANGNSSHQKRHFQSLERRLYDEAYVP